MNTQTIVLIIIVVLAIAFAAYMYWQKEKTRRLRSKFGPEYDRAVDQYGDQRKAEGNLLQRQERIGKLHIRDLDRAEVNRFADAWQAEQTRFVDAPKDAVANADHLVGDLMKARGYPVGDFEQSAADISVDHPIVVENYRAAHGIALRDSRGEASTEDLRQAMVHYRTLFEDLLNRHAGKPEEVKK